MRKRGAFLTLILALLILTLGMSAGQSSSTYGDNGADKIAASAAWQGERVFVSGAGISEWAWQVPGAYDAVLPELTLAAEGASSEILSGAEISLDSGATWDAIDLSSGRAEFPRALDRAGELYGLRLRIENTERLKIWIEPSETMEMRLIKQPTISGDMAELALANWSGKPAFITMRGIDEKGMDVGLLQMTGQRLRQEDIGALEGLVLDGDGLTVSLITCPSTSWPVRIIASDDQGGEAVMSVGPRPEAVNTTPIAWPTETIGAGGWTVYTQLNASIKDDIGNPDCSRGATSSGSVDISRGDSPYYDSCLYAYDTVNQVFFYRVRVDGMPLTNSARTGGTRTGSDPFGNNTWNLLVDLDGDGWKEFNIVLSGDSGGGGTRDISTVAGTNDGDDLRIYYSNSTSQCVTSPTIANNLITANGDLVWWGNAGTKDAVVPGAPAADGATWDFGRSRCVVHTAANGTWGAGYFVDFQFPLSACTSAFDSGTQLWGSSTPVTFGYTTSNSNSDPLQKDFASTYCYGPSCTTKFPYSDALTVNGGLTQFPIIGDMSLSGITCPSQATVGTIVVDALQVVPPGTGSGTVTDTIASVTFQYYFDTNGNGQADDGSTWTNMAVVGSSLNPDTNGDLAPNGTTASFNDWGVVWNSSALASGQYIIRVTAVDDNSNSTTKNIGTYNRVTGDCHEGTNPTWMSYSNAARTVLSDSFANSPSCYAYMKGDFTPVTTYNVAFYNPSGTSIQSTAILSQSFGSLEGSLLIDGTRPAGTYHSVVYPQSFTPPSTYNGTYNSSTNPFEADDTFVVTSSCSLGTPVISSVSDADACAQSGVTITWGAVSGATGYDLYVDSTTIVTGVTSPYLRNPGDTSSHNYQVRAKDATCTGSWSTAVAGTDANNGVGAPTISSVVDADACAQSGVTITWGAVSGATGYDLYVDSTTIVTGVTSPYLRNPGDTSSHNYQVRAKNASCTGSWSAVVAGTDANNGVGAPTISSVVDADACAQSGVTITWGAVSGATGYDLYVDSTTTVTGVTSPYLRNPGDTSSHNYQVRAKNASCTGSWSAVVAGTDANNGVGAPTISSVVDADACAQSGVTITWGAVSGATGYDLYVDSTTTVTGVTSPYLRNPGDTSSHNYQVRAKNASCTGSWSAVVAGTDANNGLGASTISSVVDADACAQSGVTITWGAVSGATGYDLYVDSTTIVTGVTSPYLRNPGDTSSHNYQVRAKNASCTGSWSAVVAGTDANNGVGAPTISGVNDIDAYALTGVSITWGNVSGATGYDLYVDSTTIVPGVTSPYTYLPGNSTVHNYQVRAKNASCTGSWSTGVNGADLNNVPNAPTMNGPLAIGQTAVTGTSDAPDGSTVTVYVGGTPYTGTVSGGTYSVTVPALAGGDQVYATVTVSGQTSAPSATQTVDYAAPAVNAPIYGGATSVSGTSTSPVGTTVTIYVGGVPVGTSTVQSGGVWTVTGIGPLSAGDSVTATAGTGAAESVPSTPVIVSAAPVQSLPPIVSSPIYAGGSVTVTGSSIEPPGSTITVYVNGSPVGTTTVQADGSWSMTGVSVSDGQPVTATAQAGGEVPSNPSNSVSAAANSGDLTPAPVITTPVYGEAVSVSGTSVANAVVDVYLDGDYLGTTTASGAGIWTLGGLAPLQEGTIMSATATISPTGTSIWSVPVVVGGIIHLLRSDKMTSLSSYNPNNIFVRRSPLYPAMDPIGANHYYNDGEGALESGNGTSDDDDFYLRDVHSPVIEPDATVLDDASRPLVFYEVIDNHGSERTIYLSKEGGVITITFEP